MGNETRDSGREGERATYLLHLRHSSGAGRRAEGTVAGLAAASGGAGAGGLGGLRGGVEVVRQRAWLHYSAKIGQCCSKIQS